MSVIDAYLEQSATPAQKEALQHIRDLVNAEIPGLEEVISYAIPTQKYKGKNLLHFAAYKDHLSLFPTAEPTDVFKEQLKDFKTSKGTIKFSETHPLPDQLILDIVRYRVAQIDGK